MSKLSLLLIIFIAALLFSNILTSAARPNPTHDVRSAETLKEHEVFSEEVGCEGLGAEACLEKTTSNAHTDYIYTQPHPPQKP